MPLTETRDHPDLVATGLGLLARWREEALATACVKEDPLDTVLTEGGPLHVRDHGEAYFRRLRGWNENTGNARERERNTWRSQDADRLHPGAEITAHSTLQSGSFVALATRTPKRFAPSALTSP